MPSFASAVGLCCLAAVQLVLAERLVQEADLHDLETDLVEHDEADLWGEKCKGKEEECTNFAEGDPCSCLPYLQDQAKKERIIVRAKDSLFKIVQSLRYLSDYAETENLWDKLNVFKKYKHAKIFSASLKDFEFVQGAIDREELEEVRKYAETPVNSLDTVPAGSFPITVDIWDNDVTTEEFLGEAGIPLKLGKTPYSLELRPNEARNPTTAEKSFGRLGEVHVTTDVSYDTEATAPCSYKEDMNCTEVKLEVTVQRAAALNNKMDLVSKIDPLAVVRVKKFDDSGATEDKTEAIDDSDKPVWNKVFTYSWEAVVITIEGKKVLWSLDQEDLLEQFSASAELVAKKKVLDGKDCFEISDTTKTKRQKEVCDFLTPIAEERTDESAISKAKEQLSEDDQQTLTRMEGELKKHDSAFIAVAASSFLDVSTERAGSMMAVRAGRRAGRKSGGSRGHRGGGGGKCSECVLLFVAMIVIIIIIGAFSR